MHLTKGERHIIHLHHRLHVIHTPRPYALPQSGDGVDTSSLPVPGALLEDVMATAKQLVNQAFGPQVSELFFPLYMYTHTRVHWSGAPTNRPTPTPTPPEKRTLQARRWATGVRTGWAIFGALLHQVKYSLICIGE